MRLLCGWIDSSMRTSRAIAAAALLCASGGLGEAPAPSRASLQAAYGRILRPGMTLNATCEDGAYVAPPPVDVVCAFAPSTPTSVTL